MSGNYQFPFGLGRILHPVILFENEGGGAGGGDAGAGDAGAGADAGAAAAALAGAAGDAGTGGESARWWENTEAFNDDQRASMTALGLTVDDPNEAIAKLVDMEMASKKKLGAGPDQLMTKPKEGQELTEWRRENAALFGIPETAEGYDIKPPESWPKEAKWDSDLEAAARKMAHEKSYGQEVVQDFVNLFSGHVAGMNEASAGKLQAATSDMQAALAKDWGDQYNANVAMAQQAGSVVAAEAGLSGEDVFAISTLLSQKTGDPQTLKMFAAIGKMMGEDQLAGLGKGENSMGDTPAAARAKLQKMRAPGGEYYEATSKGDRAEMERLKPEIDRLTKLAAG